MVKDITRRSIQISGKVTSLALEPAFWDEIDRRAEVAGLSWADYTRTMLERIGPSDNRASAIKGFLMSSVAKARSSSANSILIAITGPTGSSKQRFRGGRLLVGRDPDNEIVLGDPKASRVHAALLYDNTRWWICDLGSSNGVWFRKKRVRLERLPPGQKVTIGDHELVIVR